MQTRNKVAVLVESQYIPEEIETYQKVFPQHGFEVDLMSSLWGQPSLKFVGEVETEGAIPKTLTVHIDFDSKEIDWSKYAAILIAANYVSVRLRYFEKGKDPRNAPAVRLFSRMMRDEKIVKGALCHGLWILTPAPESLAGRKVTCLQVVQADVQNAGALLVYKPGTDAIEEVVTDQDLVTGYSAKEAKIYSEAIVRAITAVGSSQQAPEPVVESTLKRRVLILLSEWGYWGEELIGPLEEFDKTGYLVDFCTPTGKRPNAIPVSMDATYIDPPLGRSVTSEEMAAKVRNIDDPSTDQGRRLERPINLAGWLPERPYAAAPCYVRALEAYHRQLDRALEKIKEYDALLIVGGSGPIVDLANNSRVHDLILGFIHAEGGAKPVAAECYGVTCLAFARNWEDRKSIIWGKRVTGHCLEYDYKDGTGFVKKRDTFLDFNMGPPPYPLEYILRDATGPGGAYVGNFGHETSVIVDYPFVTGRSTPDSYLTGKKLIEVIETQLARWGW